MSDIQSPQNSEKLSELIGRYCAQAEEMLEKAPDYPSALQLKESLCSKFQKECESSLVVNATRHYLDTLLKHRWKV